MPALVWGTAVKNCSNSVFRRSSVLIPKLWPGVKRQGHNWLSAATVCMNQCTNRNSALHFRLRFQVESSSLPAIHIFFPLREILRNARPFKRKGVVFVMIIKGFSPKCRKVLLFMKLFMMLRGLRWTCGIVAANPAFKELVGLEPNDVIGKSFYELFSGCGRPLDPKV